MPKKNLFCVILAVCFYGFTPGQVRNIDYFIETGLKNNPALIELRNLTLLNGIDSMIVRSGLRTQVNLNSGAMYAPVGENYGFDSAITNGGNYSGVISATQELFTGKVKNVQLQSISISNQSVLLNSKLSENDLRREISTMYLTAYADYQELSFDKTLLESLSGEQKVLKQLVDRGIYLQSDLISFSLSVSAQDIAIRQSEIQYKNDLSALNYVCGISDTASIILEAPKVTLQNNFDVNNSIFLRQLWLDSIRSESGKALIDLNYRPHLNAFAEAGFNSIIPENIPKNLGASVGLLFTVPIYDGNQKKILHNKFSIMEDTRLAKKSFYMAQYNQRHKQLTEQLRLNDELILDIKDQVSGLSNLIDLYKAEIEKGLIRVIDFLSIIKNYSEMQKNLRRQEIARLQIINQMNYLK